MQRREATIAVAEAPKAGRETGKEPHCWKVKGAKIIVIPASKKDADARKGLSREIDHAIGETRRRGEEVDPGLVRAKEAIDDEKNHLLIARSRWGDLLGSLSYTFPDTESLRVDFIGLLIHRCGLGTRLMAAVATIALRGGRKIRLTAQKDAKGFFERLGMEKLEEYPDGNCSFEFSPEGMKRLVESLHKTL
jgi:hypothetical protein